jgi:mannose-1-phosphate guanylyltransferase
VVYGVILAGGKGERFWPLSRADRPKQFLKLTSGKTMLEETIERVLPLIPMENIRVVTSEQMCRIILDSMDYVKVENILCEPIGRNTCVAIGLAAAHLLKEDPHAIMVVLSADHLIRPAEKLLEILKAGTALASAEDRLITIGITPTRPETDYGYIKLGDMYKYEGGCVVYNVSGFTEKPKAQVAHEYYYSHNYLWNSGMFVWSAKSILKAIGACQPEMSQLLSVYSQDIGTETETISREEMYRKAVSISIDFAVLENAENVLTIKGDIIWDDIGGWRALERYKEIDRDNNIVIGDAVMVETYETTIYNNSEGIITTLGVSDLVIVRTDNITMVAHRTKAAEIKKILNKLEENEKTRQHL